MVGSGGKGGNTTQTTKVELPKSLETGAKSVLASALRAASLPYSPNRGVTIAAFSPDQMAAFQGGDQMAMALGLPNDRSTGNVPTPTVGANGVRGYSTGALYDENVRSSMSARDIAMREALLGSYADNADKIQPNKAFDAARNPRASTKGSGSTSSAGTYVDPRTNGLAFLFGGAGGNSHSGGRK